MWFKQAQIFQLADSIHFSSNVLCEKLGRLEFQNCLPPMPYGAGWVSPVDDEEAPLIQTINNYIMICLQVEEKILPPIVIRQELAKQIKKIEASENRKVGQKEKYALKDSITTLLLPRAFSKLTKLYAYIDTKNHQLILGTTNEKKTEQFMSAWKKSIGENINPFPIKKASAVMTSWLKNRNYSTDFLVEKSCVLQDTHHQARVIRCKEQDLFANSIQSLIKDGCEVKQLALNWKDRVDFILLDDLCLQSIRFKDEIIAQATEKEAGTKQQQFNADFFIMTETLVGLLEDLLNAFIQQPIKMKKTNIDKDNVISMGKVG